MDNMNNVSKFTTGIISQILKTIIRKKLGYNIDISINNIKATVDDGITSLHLDVDADMSKEELTRMIKDFTGK